MTLERVRSEPASRSVDLVLSGGFDNTGGYLTLNIHEARRLAHELLGIADMASFGKERVAEFNQGVKNNKSPAKSDGGGADGGQKPTGSKGVRKGVKQNPE